MLTRRQVLQGGAAMGVGVTGCGSYALAEPWQLDITHYKVTPPNWPSNLKLRTAALADFHFCEPFMSAERARHIVERTNALKCDAVALLGDYAAGTGISRFSRHVPARDWAAALAGLKAPYGVHAVLGNHDWWEDDLAVRMKRAPAAQQALEAVGIPVHNNRAVRFEKNGAAFWIAGIADQWALGLRRLNPGQPGRKRYGYDGFDDLPGTLAQVTDTAPTILLVHEPDIFPNVPSRVSLTLAGHTHGGQVTFMGYAPRVPSRYGRRYLYGHIVEDSRSLVVSGGLGCSGLPVRFGRPPEIVVVELGSDATS